MKTFLKCWAFAALLALPAAAQNMVQAPTAIIVPAGSSIRGVATTATAVTYTIDGVEQFNTSQIPKQLAQGQLPAVAASLYAPTASYVGLVSSIHLNNASGSDVAGVILYKGGTAASNQIFGPVTIVSHGSCDYTSGAGWTCTDANGALATSSGGGTAYYAGTGLNQVGTTFNLVSPVTTTLGGTGANLNAAAAGRYPKADGLGVFAASSLGAAGPGTCTNQFARVLNQDATPTCASVVNADFSGLLSNVHGGTGVDSSGSTGLAHIAAGTWTFSAADLSGTDATGILACARAPPFTGDVTSTSGTCATVLANIPTATPAAGTILHTNIAAPSSPAAGKVSVFSDSTDLRLHDKNAAGSIGTTVVADTGATNNFLTAISAAGAVSKAQPQFSNLGGSATCAQLPALTGGVTTSAGSCGTTVITNANLTGPVTSTGNATAIANGAISNAMLANGAVANLTGTNSGDVTLGNIGASPNAKGATLAGQALNLEYASATFGGLITAEKNAFLSAYRDNTIVLVTNNSYANIACDGTTDDAAAWNTITANAPAKSVLVMPPCTSVIKSAITTTKHFSFRGAGIDKSIIQSNVNAADFLTIGDWYTTIDGISFNGLATTVTNAVALSGAGVSLLVGSTTGFPASGSFYVQTNLGWTLAAYTSISDSTHFAGVTAAASTTVAAGPITVKTGGQAVDAGTMNHVFLRDVGFSYVYDGFRSDGTICGIMDSNIFGEVNFGIEFNGTNVNSVVHNVTADGAPPAVAHLEVKQAGSLLISDDDLIRAQSNLRLNPTSPNGVFGVYAVNTYFDTATGVSGTANSGNNVLVQGTGNVQRIKFVNSWMSSATHDGIWLNSTAATLPTDIEVTNSNIYSNGAFGMEYDTVQDFITSSNQISGNVTAGIELTAGAGSVTNGSIHHNQVGPAGGIGANGTGLIANAGTYGNLTIDYNDLSGNTTAAQSGLPGTIAAPNVGVLQSNNGMFMCPPSESPVTALPLTTVTRAGSQPCVMRAGGRIGSWAKITVDVSHAATIATLTPTLKYGTNNSNADTTIHTGSAVAGTANLGTCTYVWTFRVVTATTAMVTFKYYNGNGAAATTGCSTANTTTAPTASVAITNINTLAYLAPYFASSVNAINTIQSVSYEYGQ